MDFKLFGKEGASTLMLIPGLGVSYEIFLPLIDMLEDQFRIIAVQVEHLKNLYPDVHVEVFPKMNHGQLLVDHPEEVAKRIKGITDNHYC